MTISRLNQRSLFYKRYECSLCNYICYRLSHNYFRRLQARHILKAGLDPGPWTLDSGLWFFSLKTLFPPEKNLYISPPPKKPLYPPEKPLYLHHETPPSPHKHFFPQI